MPNTDAPTDRGLPRPTALYQGRPLPVPWINGDNPFGDDWLAFDDDRACEVWDDRLCVVCGKPIVGPMVIGRYRNDDPEDRPETAAGEGHARCIWLAVQTCPHLRHIPEDQPVAYLYTGPDAHPLEPPPGVQGVPYEDLQRITEPVTPLTRAELKELARLVPSNVPQTAKAG